MSIAFMMYEMKGQISATIVIAIFSDTSSDHSVKVEFLVILVPVLYITDTHGSVHLLMPQPRPSFLVLGISPNMNNHLIINRVTQRVALGDQEIRSWSTRYILHIQVLLEYCYILMENSEWEN
jgi:hypothetical protein